jgi:L-amino acid N-acyltransferase YncA
VRLRLAEAADQPRVTEIAAGAFAADRFHLDPNLPPGKADERFRQWVGRSFAAREPIYVLEDLRQGRVQGFVQCRETGPKLMDVTLGGVDKTLQQSGAGVLMYQLLFIEFIAQGHREAITRVSLHNIGGIKLTLRLGFTVRSAVTTLHWFKAGKPQIDE